MVISCLVYRHYRCPLCPSRSCPLPKPSCALVFLSIFDLSPSDIAPKHLSRLCNIRFPFIAVRVIANCTVLVHLTPMPTSSSFCLYHTSSLAAIKSFHQSSARVRSRFSLYVVLILCMLGCVYCLCQSMVCFKCVACEPLVIAST